MESEKKFYSVAEVAEKLGKELKVSVTESKIRRYESEMLTDVKRAEGNEYRQFSEDNIEQLKIIIMLGEIGLNPDEIKLFITEPNNAQLIIQIVERISALDSILIVLRDYMKNIGIDDKAGGVK